MLTQTLVEVALAKLVQCIPQNSPLENQSSIFHETHVNREFHFNMDSIDLNIKVWHSTTIKLSLSDCQTFISMFRIKFISQLQSFMKDQYAKSKCHFMKSSTSRFQLE